MHRTVKSLLLIAACCAGLAGCGGNGQSTTSAADAAQSKQLTRTQKATASSYATVVEQLYVAYFGRPADPTGLANFEAQLASVNAPTDLQGILAQYQANNATIKSLIDSFGNSSESQKLYGNSDATAFVTAVFQNVLGRAPLAAGLNFWVSAINGGTVTYGEAALSIMEGALTNPTTQGLLDAQLIDNRITVALSFTTDVTTQSAVSYYSGSVAAAAARTMLSTVTASTDTTAFQTTVDTTVVNLIPANVVPIVIDAGADPANIASIDEPYVSVTICSPANPSVCQTIDHILVDTGSYGLRVISTVLNSGMAAALSAESSTNTLAECTVFIDGYTWGPLRQVDVQIGREKALNVNMQVIGDPNFAGLVPSNCANTGKSENTVKDFGSNGVLGVGLFQQDCGNYCTANTDGDYFICSSSVCNPTSVSLAQQVNNPVALFANDNNGVIITLPTTSFAGEASVSGTMTFGINTSTNNSLGSASIFQMNSYGDFTTIFGGKTLPNSFIDSGSNGLYFPNLTNIATCADGFYCPPSLLPLSATMQGSDGANSQSIPFVIGNIDTAILGSTATQNYAVYAPLGAPNGDQTSFDWGLPFFYGKSVFVVMDGQAVGGKTGPYVAF
jgi:hypothetical protein